MLNFKTKKIIKLFTKKKVLLNKIFINKITNLKSKTNFIVIQKEINNFKLSGFTKKNLAKNKILFSSKNINFSSNLIKKFFSEKTWYSDVAFVREHLLKSLFSKNVSTLEINFYLKKLINSFLSYYNLQIKRLKYLLNNKVSSDLIFGVHKNLIPSKDIFLLKNLLFLIKTRNKFTNKAEFVIQKRFFLFLFKHEKNIINNKERYYFKKLLLSYFKKSKKISLIKKNILNYKKAIRISYSKNLINENNNIYKKLVGLILKKGNKSKALKIVESSLLLTSIKLKLPINLILNRLFNRLKTSIESKKIRVRRSFHFVPFPVNSKRKVYLIAKWILSGIKKAKTKGSFDFKLHTEIIKILKTKQSISYKSKRYNIFKSLQNKSNLHFRW